MKKGSKKEFSKDKQKNKNKNKNKKINKKTNKNLKEIEATKPNLNARKNKKKDRKNTRIKKSGNTKYKHSLDEKLKFIGIDKDNIPSALLKQGKTNFKLNSLAKDKSEDVYIYLNIKDLEFLLTEKNSDEDLSVKYKDAKSISEYLTFDENDELKAKDTLKFLKLIENLDENEISRIEKMQEIFLKSEPDSIRYFKSNKWNIYYSGTEKKNFMLVCIDEGTNEFLYALKEKIKCITNNKDKHIYVPISYIEQSTEFLTKEEKNEFENILWYYTRNWPMSFDLYNKNNEYSLNFVGDIDVFERAKGRYRLEFKEKEDVLKYFKTLKAIYTIEHDTKKHIFFETLLSKEGSLVFKYKDKEVSYEKLPELFKEIISAVLKSYDWYVKELEKRALEHEIIKTKMEDKEKTYQKYQNEIVRYLNIKDTFFGKFKYFLESNNILKRMFKENSEKYNISAEEKYRLSESEKEKVINKINEEINIEIKKTNKDLNVENIQDLKTKQDITVEDIIKTYDIYISIYDKTIDLINDINAGKLFLINIDRKISNAKKYLKEIEFSKRSIFSFWKFTNKDNIKELSEPEEIKLPHEKTEEERNKIEVEDKKEKIFNYEIDFLNFSENVDTIQRKKLTNEEISSIYAAKYLIKEINLLNDLEHLSDEDEENKNKKTNILELLEKSLENLKKEFKNKEEYIDASYDIFGKAEKAETVRYMKDKSFREKDRNIYESIHFNKNMNVDEYIERLKDIENILKKAFLKITADQKISLYALEDLENEPEKDKYKMFNLDIVSELKDYSGNKDKLKLIKLNIRKDVSLLYYTNIVFYMNNNKTLPLGMENSTNVLINMKDLKEKYTLKKEKEKSIYINKYFDKPTNVDREIEYNKVEEIVSENNIKEIIVEEITI